MILLPKIKIKRGDHPGNQVLVQLPDLSEYEKTFLSADEVSGQTALSVSSSVNFAANEYIVIGNAGQDDAEIRLISSVSTGAITVSSATTFAHSRGTVITFIPFNQVEISTDDNTGFTSPTVLITTNLRIDSLDTFYEATTGGATDYYRARFYHEQGVRYSGYSDVVISTGYGDGTVFAIKDRALKDLGYEVDDKITEQFLNTSLWEARRDLDNDSRVLRWSFRTKFDADIGTIYPGTWRVAVPTDLRDQNTHKNLLSIRIGKENRPLEYQDKVRFNQNYLNIAHTTLNGAVLTSDTSITLTDSGDFTESGNIDIAGSTATDVVDSVAYTANNETTNVISGVTGIKAAGHASGADVWQGVTFGFPTFYTVHAGYIYFDVPFENNLAGEHIYADYYSTLVSYDSDADVLDEPEYDLFTSYLKYKIKYRKANGDIDPTKDADYLEWIQRKNNLISKEMLSQNIYLVPDI